MKLLAEAVCTLFLFLLVVSFLGFLMFWPWTTEGTVTHVRYESVVNRCEVTFDDGRTVRFSGIPPKSLKRDRYYVITYNNLNYFYKVEEKEQ